MYLLLAILAVLALLIIFILLLPVKIYIKCASKQPTKIAVKIMFFNLLKPRKKPKKQSKFAEKIKNALGLSKFEKKNIKTSIKENGISETVSEVFSLLKCILNTLLSVVKKLKISRLHAKVVVASNDAAATALYYGGCCAAVGTALGTLGSAVKIKEKGKKINVLCDFSETECEFYFETLIKVSIFSIVLAGIRFVLKRVKP